MIWDLAYLKAGIQDYVGTRAPNFAVLNGKWDLAMEAGCEKSHFKEPRFGTPGNEESEMTYLRILHGSHPVILPWHVMICTCKGWFPFDRSIAAII